MNPSSPAGKLPPSSYEPSAPDESFFGEKPNFPTQVRNPPSNPFVGFVVEPSASVVVYGQSLSAQNPYCSSLAKKSYCKHQ